MRINGVSYASFGECVLFEMNEKQQRKYAIQYAIWYLQLLRDRVKLYNGVDVSTQLVTKEVVTYYY